MTDKYERMFLDFAQRPKPHLLHNVFYKWAAMLTNLVIVFVMTPLILEYVGKAGFGIWTISVAIVGYYGLVNLGVTSAVAQFSAVAIGQRDRVAMTAACSTAFLMFVVTGLVVAFLVQPLAPWIAGMLSVDEPGEFEYLIRMMGLSVALSFPTSVMVSILVAHECFRWQSLVPIVTGVTRALLISAFLFAGFGIKGLANAFVVTSAIDFLAHGAIILWRLPWVRVAISGFSAAKLVEMLKFGVPSAILSVSVILRSELDNVVIAGFVGLKEVAIYSVAALIVKNIFSLANGGLGAFTPRYARMIGERKKDVVALVSASTFYAGVIAFGAFDGVFLFGGKFLSLWLGKGFEESVLVLWVLMGCYVVTLVQIPGYNFLMACNQHKKFAVFTLVEGCANVALSIYLANRLGLIGVAIGTAIPMIILRVFVQPYFVTRAAETSLGQYLAPLAIPAASGLSLMFVGMALELPARISALGWSGFSIAAALFMLVYLAATLGTALFWNRTLLDVTAGRAAPVCVTT